MTSLAMPSRYNNAVISHIMVKNANQAINFYKKAFNATELFRLTLPNQIIMHAELKVEESVFMIGEANEPFSAPIDNYSTTVALHLYVKDVDTFSKKAVEAGAEILQPLQNMFYGARQIMIKDPFGHIWVILTHTENLTETEIIKRAEAFFVDKS